VAKQIFRIPVSGGGVPTFSIGSPIIIEDMVCEVLEIRGDSLVICHPPTVAAHLRWAYASVQLLIDRIIEYLARAWRREEKP
jgi:hypothetical protein